MSRTEDLLNAVQKTVGDAPLYLLAGAGDLVAEKLRELPDVIDNFQREQRDVPLRAAGNLVGAAFRANLKIGEIYDDLTRRGQEVVAKMRGDDIVDEDDEPFVREPFMPEPVRRAPAATAPAAADGRSPTKKAAAKKAAKKAPATKTVAETTGTDNSAAGPAVGSPPDEGTD